ncbi:hypothetical protein MycrhDRAFT_5774 [Mycolicibacterium rhodesiae JS60]|nr:hypothetical protein MycrhDRAFT_5774 [Mycolicibacterium rhodesiae JS60]
MGQRATLLTLDNGMQLVYAAEPILDKREGVLVLAFDDGSSRNYNWDKVLEFYHLSEEEYERMRAEMGSR